MTAEARAGRSCAGPALAAPLTDPGEVGPLCDAGADELYCGVLPPEWRKRFSTVVAFNRLHPEYASLRDLDALRRVVREAHDRGVKVFLALNDHFYPEGEHEWVRSWLGEAVPTGVDSVIISDLGLFLAAREDHPEARLCASTGMVALNSESVGFLSQLGASRVILERQLGIGEVRRIKEAHPGVELEAFILNGRCRNIEGFCTFQHGHQDVLHPVHPAVGRVLYRAMHHPLLYSVGVRLPRWMTERGPVERAIAEVYNPCRFTYEVGVEGPAACAASERIRSFLGRKVQAYCGGCALHELWEAGVDAVKVVGRIFPTSRRVEDTRFIAGLLRRLREERPAREEFHAMAREAYRSRFGVACDFESCYYPDAGWAGGP